MLLKKGLKLRDIYQVGLRLLECSSIDDFLLKHPSSTIDALIKAARRDLLETRIENQIRETDFPPNIESDDQKRHFVRSRYCRKSGGVVDFQGLEVEINTQGVNRYVCWTWKVPIDGPFSCEASDIRTPQLSLKVLLRKNVFVNQKSVWLVVDGRGITMESGNQESCCFPYPFFGNSDSDNLNLFYRYHQYSLFGVIAPVNDTSKIYSTLRSDRIKTARIAFLSSNKDISVESPLFIIQQLLDTREMKKIVKNGGSFYTGSVCTVPDAIDIRPLVSRICDTYPLHWFAIRLRTWESEDSPDNFVNGVVGCLCVLSDFRKVGNNSKKRVWVHDPPSNVEYFKSLGGSSSSGGGGGGSKIMKRKPSKALLGSSVKK
jgi:hypothetical protein